MQASLTTNNRVRWISTTSDGTKRRMSKGWELHLAIQKERSAEHKTEHRPLLAMLVCRSSVEGLIVEYSDCA